MITANNNTTYITFSLVFMLFNVKNNTDSEADTSDLNFGPLYNESDHHEGERCENNKQRC